jgi:hypothetical protein
MKVTSETLFKIAAMPEQAMVVALTFLAEQLEAHEAKGNANALRQRRYRDNHKGVTVTQQRRNDNADVTPSRVEDIYNLSKPTKKDLDNLSLSLSKPPCLNPRANGTNPRALGTNPRAIAQEPEDFAAFMAVYPKRGGSIDRKAALKAFGPALKRVDLETLMHAAKAYNADMTAKAKIGTEFVKQARTWLNGDCWNDHRYQSKAEQGGGVVQVPVFEDTPAMAEWTRHLGKRPFITDIHIPGKQVRRGAYFPSEYPPSQQKDQAA